MIGAVADIAILAVLFLIIRGSAFAGARISRASNRRWLGVSVGLIVAGLLFAVSIPSIRALTGVQCQGDADYAACLDGD